MREQEVCLPVCLFMFFMCNRDNCDRNYPIALYFDDYSIKMYLIWCTGVLL